MKLVVEISRAVFHFSWFLILLARELAYWTMRAWRVVRGRGPEPEVRIELEFRPGHGAAEG